MSGMKLYTFCYYFPPEETWRAYFAPSEEEAIRVRGVKLKYLKNTDWVGHLKVITINPNSENICAMLNSAIEGDVLWNSSDEMEI